MTYRVQRKILWDENIEPDREVTLKSFEKGNKVIINGTIPYGQDFGFWKNAFPGVVFTVEGPNGDWLRLTAPGYGDLKNHNYGNGAIFIGKSYLHHLRKMD